MIREVQSLPFPAGMLDNINEFDVRRQAGTTLRYSERMERFFLCQIYLQQGNPYAV